jgi:putative FmdB family regulatory protein
LPTYDYKCKGCDRRFEVFHGMGEEIVVVCQHCGNTAKKVPSIPNLGKGATALGRRLRDTHRADVEMRTDLKETYGVEKVYADGGRGLSEVYNDVKGAGSYVKERMAQEAEKNNAWRDGLRKERQRTAPQRIPKRQAEAAERSKAKMAKARAISLSSG